MSERNETHSRTTVRRTRIRTSSTILRSIRRFADELVARVIDRVVSLVPNPLVHRLYRARVADTDSESLERSQNTFAAHGRALGLEEDAVLDALATAIRVAGPARGGRFVCPHHVVDEDRTSRAALEAMERAAKGTECLT